MQLHTDRRNKAPVPTATKIEVKRLANFQCVLCSEPETQWLKLEIHHLIRRFDGGSNEISNLMALCPNCHSKLHSGDKK
jgi:5-methylcytosine-specific restriction endonuclease McrA